MESVSFNIVAVLVSALLAFVIGGLWYSPILFAKAWMREAGLTEEQTRKANLALSLIHI